MTEIEIATTEHMQIEQASAIVERIQYSAELIMDAGEFGFTLIFGYLVAAYYFGSKLNRIQLCIFNFLFIAIQFVTQMNIRGSYMAMLTWFDRLEEVLNDTYRPYSATEEFYIVFPIIGITFTSACLYFMWSIRNHRIE